MSYTNTQKQIIMNQGQLISKLVKSEGDVHNLKRELSELKLKLISLTNEKHENKKEILLEYEKWQQPKTWYISKNEVECRVNKFLKNK